MNIPDKVLTAVVPFLIIFLMSLSGCKKESLTYESVQVIRNCTGTYLRINQKEYVVCNLEKVAGFEDSVFIDASFKKITTCNGSARNQIRCLMVYPSEGIIEVIRAE